MGMNPSHTRSLAKSMRPTRPHRHPLPRTRAFGRSQSRSSFNSNYRISTQMDRSPGRSPSDRAAAHSVGPQSGPQPLGLTAVSHPQVAQAVRAGRFLLASPPPCSIQVECARLCLHMFIEPQLSILAPCAAGLRAHGHAPSDTPAQHQEH